MPKVPENEASTEVQESSLLATDDKQELTSNTAHIEVPVAMLTAQDTFVENQPDEQTVQLETQRSEAEKVGRTGRYAKVGDQNDVGDDNDNTLEKQLNVMERQEEPADETVTNMTVQVRSGAQVSVACGEGEEHMSSEVHRIKSKANIKPASPTFQYSSDAAATGLYNIVRIFEKCGYFVHVLLHFSSWWRTPNRALLLVI